MPLAEGGAGSVLLFVSFCLRVPLWGGEVTTSKLACMVEDGQYMCKSRTTPRDWFKCTRPEHPAHGGVMLCTVQCRPASACARKSPPRGCTRKKQDKTRQPRKRPEPCLWGHDALHGTVSACFGMHHKKPSHSQRVHFKETRQDKTRPQNKTQTRNKARKACFYSIRI